MSSSQDRGSRPDSLPDALTQRLRKRFGDEADPQVDLRSDDDEEGGLAGEVVRRLSAREGSFGRYELKGELARGGQGAVFKVWDTDLRRNLAMKVVLGDGEGTTDGTGATTDSKTLGRFLEEAQVTGQLDHPGIVPIHELGLDDEGRVYFTMKLVRGRELAKIFELVHEKQEGWTITRALGLMLKVCEAMSYAHHKGVIHRDLKPANVMVGRFGAVYVMDWGIARVLDREDRKDIRVKEDALPATFEVQSERKEKASSAAGSALITMDGDVIGTPAYMSPEQANGRLDEIGPQADVYSLGAMLYHLFTGQMPYVPRGASVNNYVVWGRVQEEAPKPVAELAPDLPGELVAICEKAMARELPDRYASVEALAEDLQSFIEGRVVKAYGGGALAEAKKWVVRNKALATALGTAVVLLVVGLAASLLLKARADAHAVAAERSAAVAEEQRTMAEDNAELAQRRETEALAAREEVERLLVFSDAMLLENLIAEEDQLWPAHPQTIPAFETWLEKGRGLAANLAVHRGALERLQARALPWSEEERARDAAAHPLAPKLAWMRRMLAWGAAGGNREPEPTMTGPAAELYLQSLRDELGPPSPAVDAPKLVVQEQLEAAVSFIYPDRGVYGREAEGLWTLRQQQASGGSIYSDSEPIDLTWALFSNGYFTQARANRDIAREKTARDFPEYLARLDTEIDGWTTEVGQAEKREEIARLENAIAQDRATWTFDAPRDQARHDGLKPLVDGLTVFSNGLLPQVESRLDQASTLWRRSVEDHRAAWEEALAWVSESILFEGLQLTPQLGLVPIGPDPGSGLWEFADIQSGEVPSRSLRTGELHYAEESAVVFVLVPGGRLFMGAQSDDPRGPNYDPRALDNEGPVHDVLISPFLLSKYEMTQAQWERVTGSNPSAHPPGEIILNTLGTPTNPVTSISWNDANQTLSRLGWVLPSEAQWEYAARADTRTPWWTGAEASSLRRCANLADESFRESGGLSLIGARADWDDGYGSHAPVGSFHPNPLGFHDILGNVLEMVRDVYNPTFYARSVGRRDPLNDSSGSGVISRGGSFIVGSFELRSSFRLDPTPREMIFMNIGVRPARAIVRE